jgi:hypothetical protein
MNLRDLFDALSLEAIERFVADRQQEELSLDFKTGADLTTGSAKKNLAEILSGFSNSAGGVVIWGVATAKDRASGRDVASELKPITDVARFATQLAELTPIVLTPTNDGVSHRHFARADHTGFAATFVPESAVGPHMALAGHNRYFKRTDDRCYRMQHFDIADMFGRRQRPALKVSYHLSGGVTLQGYQGTKRGVRIQIVLSNQGRASAVAPFIQLAAASPFRVERAGASSRAHGEAQFEIFPDGPQSMAFVAGAGVLLHPKARIPIAEVLAEFWDHDTLVDCTIRFAHAAMDLPLIEDRLVLTSDSIAQELERPIAPKPEGEIYPTG